MNLFEKDKTYIAGTYNRFPVAIASGKGSLLYDENGREYIDLTSGIGVTAFGIADEKWQAAVIEQVGKVQHTSNLFYTAPCADLAEMLVRKTGMKKVFFSNSGAEANECAIKVARKYAADKYGENRYTVVSMKNSFHGRTLTTLAATGQDHYHELYQPLTPGFASVAPNADGLAELDALHAETPVSAVMIECIQGEGGVLPLDSDFIRALAAWCKANDALLIADEVQTGNGRTGKLYAYMNFGIEPDVVSTAKGLAGGLPLGATLLGEKVKDVFGFGDHGSTFGGNPVACAAALSVLSRIDDDLLAGVKRKGDFLRAAFTGAKGIEGVTGMGLLLGLKTTKPAPEVLAACRDRGVLCLTAKDKVRLIPALNIPDDLLAKAAQIIKAACAE